MKYFIIFIYLFCVTKQRHTIELDMSNKQLQPSELPFSVPFSLSSISSPSPPSQLPPSFSQPSCPNYISHNSNSNSISSSIPSSTLSTSSGVILECPKSPEMKKRYPSLEHLQDYKQCTSTRLDVDPRTETACFIFNSVKMLFNISAQQLRDLKTNVTKAYFADDSEYENLRLGYNKRFNFYPSVIVVAVTTEDIAKTIQFCHCNKLPFVIRSGGHGYEPASTIQFGCVIELREYDNVSLNKHNNTVTVQVGATLGELLQVVNSNNYVLPTGTCVTNGVGGYSLGGGVGFYTRKYGLTIDSILNITMVDYQGSVITVNDKCNSDLFFALRGAGGNNFGVVTSITFKVYPYTPTIVFSLHFAFDSCISQNNNIVQLCAFWQKWMNRMTPNFNCDITMYAPHMPVSVSGIYIGSPTTTTTNTNTNGKLDQVPINICNDVTTNTSGNRSECNEDVRLKEEFLKLIQPLLHFKPVQFEWKQAISPIQVSEYFGTGSYARPIYQDTKHNIAYEYLPKTYFLMLVEACLNIAPEDTFTKINLMSFGGAVKDVPDTATAFPHRKAKYWIFYSAVWGIPSEKEQVRNVTWVTNVVNYANAYFPTPHAQYINFLNYSLPTDTYLISYYGQNVKRLKQVKKLYDPHNTFTFKQGIIPTDIVKQLQ